MLRSLELLRKAHVQALDGEAGQLEDFLFEAGTWAVRYLVLDADPGMGRRIILVSPMALEQPRDDLELRIRLTREQLDRTPEVDLGEPVTRAWEHHYFRAFAWPPYWSGGAGLWGAAGHPIMPAVVPMADPTPDIGVGANDVEAEQAGAPDLHLASGYLGYHVLDAEGEEIGQVADFILDDRCWAIGYAAISTGGLLGGKKVLAPVESFRSGSWVESRVDTDLTREQIESAPNWEPLEAITPEYEARVRRHFAPPRRAAA